MSRPVYLIVYKSRLFPAHWSFWIPTPDDETIGKRIQATGDALTGFVVAFERNYDIAKTSRPHELVSLDRVDSAHVNDGDAVKGGPESTDAQPIDKLEEVALSVPAPGPSLVSSSSNVRGWTIADFWYENTTNEKYPGPSTPCRDQKLPDVAPRGGSEAGRGDDYGWRGAGHTRPSAKELAGFHS